MDAGDMAASLLMIGMLEDNEKLQLELKQAKRRQDAIRRAIGFVQDGSADVISIFQDDATMDFTVTRRLPKGNSQILALDRSFVRMLDLLADQLDKEDAEHQAAEAAAEAARAAGGGA